MSSIDGPFRVLQAVKILYQDQPWFRGAELDADDAGVHVVVRAQRSALPPAPVAVGAIDCVRVLMVVHG